MNSSPPALTVAVLAYDEEANIEPVLEELVGYLRACSIDAEILVLDDGSRDNTAAVARMALERLEHRGQVVTHATNLGMGAGLKTAARAARSEWLTFLPADGQIPPPAIGQLLQARDQKPPADVVLSVYADRDDGRARRALSWGVRALIRVVHGVGMRSDGPYLVRRTLMDADQLVPDSFFLNFELPIRVGHTDLCVRTATIPCRARLTGQSKTANRSVAVRVARDLVSMRRRRLAERARHWLG